MAITWDPKDPDEVLDRYIDWPPRLPDGDTIIHSEWEVPAGITLDDSEFTETRTTAWLSGGTEGTTYTLVNRVMTEGGRTLDQSAKIKIKTK
jgi:hypothetical protein